VAAIRDFEAGRLDAWRVQPRSMAFAQGVKSWGADGFSRRRFFNMTFREFFGPSKTLICDFGEKNATQSHMKEKVGAAPGVRDEFYRGLSQKSKILGEKAVFLWRFFGIALREIFSPSEPLFCDFAEKNGTRSDKKEEDGAALENGH
jgi:hypothetical protein